MQLVPENALLMKKMVSVVRPALYYRHVPRLITPRTQRPQIVKELRNLPVGLCSERPDTRQRPFSSPLRKRRISFSLRHEVDTEKKRKREMGEISQRATGGIGGKKEVPRRRSRFLIPGGCTDLPGSPNIELFRQRKRRTNGLSLFPA